MKILHINCNYMSTALHQTMVEHLEEIGVENTVFAPISSKTKICIKPNNNVIVSNCFRKWDRLLFYHKQSKIRKSLERSVKVTDYDCIHAYTLFTDGNVAYELYHKYGIPYCVAVRSTDVNVFFKRMQYLRGRGIDILKDARAVFFLSKTYQKQVLENYVPDELKKAIYEKSHIIPNGIDDFWIDNINESRNINEIKSNLSKRKLKVAYVGKISKNKNIRNTVAALKQLCSEGWDIEFQVAGEKQDDNEFNIMQSFKGIRYLGPLEHKDVLKCYRECDIFIMPSYKETFGLVYAEAMSQGLPVIYSKKQGFDGQFEEGEVGFAVDAGEMTQIVEAIQKISLDYENISRNCISAVERFKWGDICKKYIDIYGKFGALEE